MVLYVALGNYYTFQSPELPNKLKSLIPLPSLLDSSALHSIFSLEGEEAE